MDAWDARSDTVAIIGAGAWGTALAVVLAKRYDRVSLWTFEPWLAVEIGRAGENSVYLPGIPIPPAVQTTASLETVLSGKTLILVAVPSHVFRSVLAQARANLSPEAIVVSAAKGIELGSLSTMFRIMGEVLPPVYAVRRAVLSGPSFAPEVGLGRPTAIVAAAEDAEVAHTVQRALSGTTLRVYAGTDPLGVEVGGAFKNVMAIAAGVVDGLELGLNARAALITRGLAEIMRLGVAMGARAETFAGLSGMGDLVLTCTGDLSRNRRVGIGLARGKRLDAILRELGGVAEGVNTCRSALALAERYGVDMPICRAVHRVLFDGQDPGEAVVQLLTRELRFEGD